MNATASSVELIFASSIFRQLLGQTAVKVSELK